ncbi:MAG: hypothetical protein HY235_11210 [Acidobacteria bacterium]|nr:hypothetical protein [Acidobacteriota bacterium]
MKKETWVVLLVVINLTIGQAASPAIGVAVARGTFQLEGSSVTGTGTLFEGSMVETGKATSELQMQSGARVVLDTGTRSKVYREYLLLERGSGQIERGESYRIRARSLEIRPTGTGMAKVSLTGMSRVQVAALAAPVRVTNAAGVLVADVAAGRAVELDPQGAGAAAPSTLTGCLQKKNGHYVLTDETAGVTVELQGAGLEKEVGNKIEVTGVMDPSATPVGGSSQVIRASQVKHLAKKCQAGGAGAAAAGVGMSATSKAVIAGVVIAGAASGTAIGLTREDKESMSR